ncbi:MAG: pyruvate dehydrogenase (acetyl-transferring) E1 component subunit alpha [Acidobacteria bacterium]|nr:MAG: pyruvate dehydrogenase (acetyl-transferring) E1 component subunit alpha [Acidobacteriota bacterium]
MSSQPTEQRNRSNSSAAGVLDPPEKRDSSPSQSKELTEDRETLVKIFRQMLLIRRFEEKCAESYSLGKIGGFCHLYIGQEAVGVGSISALREDDYVLTSYREHGQAIAKGITPDAIMAELYGKATGCSRGKGGSMHLFDKDVNFLGGHAIVGGQIPLATGVAFASKYKETDQVTLCFFGEAAVNQGAFHESLNMAQLWKLPCIYICENNMYGMGTSLARAMSFSDVAQKACAYEIASEFVDGMDVLAMRHATERAVKRAREESLPTLLEARTYRYMGHSMSDPGKYRTRAEIEKYQERDPIKMFANKLKEQNVITDADIAGLEKEIKEEVEHAARFADASPLPDPSELYTNVYANPLN